MDNRLNAGLGCTAGCAVALIILIVVALPLDGCTSQGRFVAARIIPRIGAERGELAMTSTREALEDPLATLGERADSALAWTYDTGGRRRYAGVVKVPELRGRHGVWNGYGPNGSSWSYSFGWPDDMQVVQELDLYKADRVVGQVFFYRSPSRPELEVLFVFRSLRANADDKGEHMGHHDFSWWGELVGDLSG